VATNVVSSGPCLSAGMSVRQINPYKLQAKFAQGQRDIWPRTIGLDARIDRIVRRHHADADRRSGRPPMIEPACRDAYCPASAQ